MALCSSHRCAATTGAPARARVSLCGERRNAPGRSAFEFTGFTGEALSSGTCRLRKHANNMQVRKLAVRSYVAKLAIPGAIVDRLFATNSHNTYFLTWPEIQLLDRYPVPRRDGLFEVR